MEGCGLRSLLHLYDSPSRVHLLVFKRTSGFCYDLSVRQIHLLWCVPGDNFLGFRALRWKVGAWGKSG